MAQFVVRVTAEALDLGSGVVDVYTVNADAGASYDPDGAPGTLTYSWSNDANADTGTAVTYSTNLTTAQFNAGPTISLTVTDADGNTDTTTHTLSSANVGGTAVLQRELYIAAQGRAEASSDGGRTWNTWTPGGGRTVFYTPEIAADDHSYFSLDNGDLYKTSDFLATMPTLSKSFGSLVAGLWINEVDANRVVVGLNNGEVWRSLDGGSTWTLLTTFADPVRWLVESAQNPGQYWFCVGSSLRITYNSFASSSVLTSWGGSAAAVRIALSFFGNYAAAQGASGESPVKRSDGTQITFPVSVTDVRGLTHHISDDILYAADTSGSDGRVWEKAAGASSFTQIGTISGAGQVRHMVRDGASPLVLYLVADEGFYKSTDGGVTWYQVRDYSGATLVGTRLGYGSAPWVPITDSTIYSPVGEGKVFPLWNGSSNDTPPTGWTAIAYDDSAWAAPVAQTGSTVGTAIDSPSSVWIAEADGDYADGADWLYRRKFALSGGFVSSATLTIWADNELPNVYVNGVAVYQNNTGWAGGGEAVAATVTIDPTLLVADGDNVLAVRVHNRPAATSPNPTSLNYRLVIS